MKTSSRDIFQRLAAQSRSECFAALQAACLKSATQDSGAEPGA